MPTKTAQKSWKIVQSKNKKQKKIKLAIGILFLIAALLIAGSALRLFKTLTNPLGFSEKRLYNWDGKTELNLIILDKDLRILSFDPAEKKVKLVSLPDDLLVQVPGGFGTWRLSSIYDLGESEKPPQGAKLLQESVASLMGMPIDGLILIKGDDDILSTLKLNPESAFKFIKTAKTNLTPIEIFNLGLGFKQIRFDNIVRLDLESLGILNQVVQADGSIAKVTDPAEIDNFVQENLEDSRIRQEGETVAIFNGTATPGLAQKAARLISNLGANVIIQTNFERQDIKSSFIVSSKNNYTAKRLKQIFPLDCSNDPICDKLMISNMRANINIILGEDFK